MTGTEGEVENRVKEALILYLKQYGEKLYKAGSCFKSKMGTRYGFNDVYERLTEQNIFFLGIYEDAIKIESLTMKLLCSEFDLCANNPIDRGEAQIKPSLMDSTEPYLVYLAPLKEELHYCPHCLLRGPFGVVADHMEMCDVVKLIKATQKAHEKAGCAPVSAKLIQVNPLKYFHHRQRAHKFTCRFCDYASAIDKDGLYRHGIQCKQNPERPFPCLVENCDYAAHNNDSLVKHAAMHARQKAQEKLVRDFACSECGPMRSKAAATSTSNFVARSRHSNAELLVAIELSTLKDLAIITRKLMIRRGRSHLSAGIRIVGVPISVRQTSQSTSKRSTQASSSPHRELSRDYFVSPNKCPIEWKK